MADLNQIEKFLNKKKIKYKVSDLGGQVYKVEDVIKAGVNPDEILKTLIVRIPILRSSKNVTFVALVVRGKDRIDFKKVRRLFGGKCELAKPAEVKKVAGVPVGAVCPILLTVPIYIDHKAMILKHINMGSGDLTHELEMDFAVLLKVIGKYKIMDLTLA